MGVKLRCEPSGLQILVTLCHNSIWPKFRFFMLKTGLKTFSVIYIESTIRAPVLLMK